MEYVSYLTIAAYNAAIVFISAKAVSKFDFKTALSEKDPAVVTAQAAALVATQTANPPLTNPSTDLQPSSYSRITGMFGLIIMASFLWALGNALIWSMFYAVDNVSKISINIGSFFLSGSALFAPYAFNQIKSAFPK